MLAIACAILVVRCLRTSVVVARLDDSSDVAVKMHAHMAVVDYAEGLQLRRDC